MNPYYFQFTSIFLLQQTLKLFLKFFENCPAKVHSLKINYYYF